MAEVSQVPAVLWLLAAPLTAALVSLVGKLLPGRWTTLPAFLCWVCGTAWGLLQAAPAGIPSFFRTGRSLQKPGR